MSCCFALGCGATAASDLLLSYGRYAAGGRRRTIPCFYIVSAPRRMPSPDITSYSTSASEHATPRPAAPIYAQGDRLSSKVFSPVYLPRQLYVSGMPTTHAMREYMPDEEISREMPIAEILSTCDILPARETSSRAFAVAGHLRCRRWPPLPMPCTHGLYLLLRPRGPCYRPYTAPRRSPWSPE